MRYVSRPEDPERYTVELQWGGKTVATQTFGSAEAIARHWYKKFCDMFTEYTGVFKVTLYEGTAARLKKTVLDSSVYSGTGKHDVDITDMFRARVRYKYQHLPVKIGEPMKPATVLAKERVVVVKTDTKKTAKSTAKKTTKKTAKKTVKRTTKKKK